MHTRAKPLTKPSYITNKNRKILNIRRFFSLVAKCQGKMIYSLCPDLAVCSAIVNRPANAASLALRLCQIHGEHPCQLSVVSIPDNVKLQSRNTKKISYHKKKYFNNLSLFVMEGNHPLRYQPHLED